MVQEEYEVKSQHAEIFWSRTFGKIYTEDLSAVRQPTILASWFYYLRNTQFSFYLNYFYLYYIQVQFRRPLQFLNFFSFYVRFWEVFSISFLLFWTWNALLDRTSVTQLPLRWNCSTWSDCTNLPLLLFSSSLFKSLRPIKVSKSIWQWWITTCDMNT